jgi:hypothetical protein
MTKPPDRSSPLPTPTQEAELDWGMAFKLLEMGSMLSCWQKIALLKARVRWLGIGPKG